MHRLSNCDSSRSDILERRLFGSPLLASCSLLFLPSSSHLADEDVQGVCLSFLPHGLVHCGEICKRRERVRVLVAQLLLLDMRRFGEEGLCLPVSPESLVQCRHVVDGGRVLMVVAAVCRLQELHLPLRHLQSFRVLASVEKGVDALAETLRLERDLLRVRAVDRRVHAHARPASAWRARLADDFAGESAKGHAEQTACTGPGPAGTERRGRGAAHGAGLSRELRRRCELVGHHAVVLRLGLRVLRNLHRRRGGRACLCSLCSRWLPRLGLRWLWHGGRRRRLGRRWRGGRAASTRRLCLRL
mmetsp:Transcript_7096/g.18186  ORF Transcript_7096/g.18186 Transcript_7096/m.18186 type:complete len:302 (+) Transcript_7096:190-1095(+)